MDSEFIIQLLAQFPTFMGLLLLAYVQYQDSKRCEDSRDSAENRYHELVLSLLKDKHETEL